MTIERLYLVCGSNGRLYVEEHAKSPSDQAEDVGDPDSYRDFSAASARAIRANCYADAPADYRHWACERWSPTPCPVTLPAHFGCDHQAAPCQVQGADHRPCPTCWRYLCQQCQES